MYVPKDRVTNLHQGYGFIEFRSEEDADYVSDAVGLFCLFTLLVYALGCYLEFLFSIFLQAIKVLNMIKLYGKPIRVNKVNRNFIISLPYEEGDITWMLNFCCVCIAYFQASQDKKSLDVGANLFIGNLDPVSSYIIMIITGKLA